MALHGLEQEITSAFPALVQRERWKPTVVRYADDLVVLHADKGVIEQVQQLVSTWLAGMGLALKPSKTCITHTLTPGLVRQRLRRYTTPSVLVIDEVGYTKLCIISIFGGEKNLRWGEGALC